MRGSEGAREGGKRLPVSCLLSLIEWGLFTPLQVFPKVGIAVRCEVCFVCAPLVEARKIPSIDPVGRLFHFLSLNIEQRDEGEGGEGGGLWLYACFLTERERTSISVSEAGACRFWLLTC